MTTRASISSWADAHATAWAWLPAEIVITPAARSSPVSDASLLSTPRGLNEPVRWNNSALRNTRAPISRDRVADEDVVERERGGHDWIGRHHVTLYSGPAPPSGGVRRPPFAVIAPHWTQLEGVTSIVTVPSAWLSPSS